MITIPQAPLLTGDAEHQLAQLQKYIISLNEWLEIYLGTGMTAQSQSTSPTQGDKQYPIGTIYTSTQSTNPSRTLGGKWAAEGSTQLASSGLTAYIWRRTE